LVLVACLATADVEVIFLALTPKKDVPQCCQVQDEVDRVETVIVFSEASRCRSLPGGFGS